MACKGGNVEETFFTVRTPRKPGKCYKLCPFSEEYYDWWQIDKVTVTSDLTGIRGNSRNYPKGGRLNLGATDSVGTPAFIAHTTTDGGMRTQTRGGGSAGWMCIEDSCTFFTTNGFRYFEV